MFIIALMWSTLHCDSSFKQSTRDVPMSLQLPQRTPLSALLVCIHTPFAYPIQIFNSHAPLRSFAVTLRCTMVALALRLHRNSLVIRSWSWARAAWVDMIENHFHCETNFNSFSSFSCTIIFSLIVSASCVRNPVCIRKSCRGIPRKIFQNHMPWCWSNTACFPIQFHHASPRETMHLFITTKCTMYSLKIATAHVARPLKAWLCDHCPSICAFRGRWTVMITAISLYSASP